MKVWVVERGEYSGRMILGIFSTEELADQYAEWADGNPTNGYGESSYWECELDAQFNPVQRGFRLYNGTITAKSGEFKDPIWPERDPEWDGEELKMEVAERGPAPNTQVLCFEVWARDADHAAKIMTDKRRQWLVENGEYS
jgi:hypothetical protein